MKKKIILEIIALLLTLSLLLTTVSYLGYLYMPARENYGATWNMFRREQKESVDLLFLGSSLAYCNIVPAEIYQKTGHTSYILSAPYMKPDIAYYYLKEALRTQSPQAIMLDASMLFYADSEADFYKVNVGYMPFGLNRLQATMHAPAQYRAGLIFPLYNYHDQWQETAPKDYILPRADAHADLWAGYTYLDTAEPQEKRIERVYPATEEELTENFAWLQKINDLCQKKGIDLELLFTPSCEYPSDAVKSRLKKEAGALSVKDFNEQFETLGLDLQTDFFDSRHLNYNGALKFSAILADYIETRFTLGNAPHDQALWQKRIDQIKKEA